MNFNDIIQSVAQNPHSAFFYTPSIYKNVISYLFLKPVEVISVYKKEDLKFSFNQIQKLIDKGYFAYSLINYEAGFLFEEKLSSLQTKNDEKLIQFFFFDKKNVKELNSSKVMFDNFSIDKYSISEFELNRSESEFNYDIAKIKAYIKAGDTYQVNYTLKGEFSFKGSYSSFFQKLLFNQSAKYSAFINNIDKYIISLSPELFFHQKSKKIISYPMKGTTQRGYNTNADTIAETELEKSKKNLAENVMIVDLIRNDLGKICKYGSVKVPELFHIEKYESLFQMISVVKGNLRKKTKMLDILKNIFPCGSVTGAPKIRTMEIINEIEKDERGIYTGSIGLITPDEIKMNVAIRTMTIDKNTGDGVIGLGSGIVWDSEPKNEYEEVLLKSKFLTEPLDYFEIFETMKVENGKILFFDQHLERMKSAADYFLFRFSEKKIRKQIEIAISNLDFKKSFKIKITLYKCGKLNIIVSQIPKQKRNITVIISDNKILSTDKFRHFKTTNRKLYDDEYLHFSSKSIYEVLYLNEKDEIAEGSRTNIFLRKENSWFTPSLESGALAGIYRNYFIQKQNDIIEKSIMIDELLKADELILTNALRGETKVSKLFISPTEFISYNN
jgi:para-aminobenzoate synthetase / 4-amino-4-deoxychorismate lyase